jgi:ubiquinone/menaquinone biosynthesis C-methylase UbiE
MQLNDVRYVVNQDWLGQDKSSRIDLLKEMVYFFTRPLLSAYAGRQLHHATLKRFRPTYVLPERGLPYRTRRLWALRLCQARDATILLQGVGTGGEVPSWARWRPQKIMGVDLSIFPQQWEEIRHYCGEKYSVPVEFTQAPLADLAFLPDSSVDICASENVFEHCRDLDPVLREAARVLKPGGVLYATYGPLWFSSGGDHFSSRGGVGNSFNHLLLGPGEYTDFINKFTRESEEYQNGRRYLEIDLFSKLTTQEYLELFEKNGFKIKELIIETNSGALAFKNKYPDVFLQLVNKYHDRCTADDLLIKSNIVFCFNDKMR